MIRLHLPLVMSCLAGCATATPPAALISSPVDEFRERLTKFIESLRADPHAPPGFVVVAVDADETLFEGAYGMRDLATRSPMTLDTPVYNASVTKAYTGLLASILHEEGILRIGESLTDVWPDLKLPPPLDGATITIAELLSHRNEMSAGGLVFRSVWTGEISADEVPGHLALYARPNDPAFEYTNMGPFVVSAMMTARTGESWRALLRERLLEPMGMNRSSAAVEAFAPAEAAHCHTWVDGGWRSLPYKPTATMNAAGGMYASGRDSARFAQLFLSAGESGPFSSDVLARTWMRWAERSQEIWGLHRDGYGLGWDLGTYGSVRFVARSGGYAGCRAIVMFLPEHDFAIAVLSAGDASANTFNGSILTQAIDYWIGGANADERASERLAAFTRSAALEAARIDAEQARWRDRGGLAADLLRFAPGTYENPRLGRPTISTSDGRLNLQMGVFRGQIRSTGSGFVIVGNDTPGEAEPFEFIANGDGVVAIVIDDDRFERLN
jgi:CubicO group peptidase (beta-lactamase class C family)